jgi:threonine/homoserine/homoserine lactone efflux protein
MIGAGFALAAAFQPGPLQAFLFSRVAQQGWKKTLPASFAPILSDGPIALVTLVILHQLPEVMTHLLQAGGGFLLLYLAWSSFKQWRAAPEPIITKDGSVPQTIFQAVLVNLLNPNPYLGWSLILGPAAIAAWAVAPIRAVALVGSFYFTIVVGTMVVIRLFGLTGFLSDERRHSLVLISAIILAVLGAYQLMSAISYMVG